MKIIRKQGLKRNITIIHPIGKNLLNSMAASSQA